MRHFFFFHFIRDNDIDSDEMSLNESTKRTKHQFEIQEKIKQGL